MTVVEYEKLIASPFRSERISELPGGPLIVIDDDMADLGDPGSAPIIVCCVGESLGAPGSVNADLVVAAHDTDALCDSVAAAPLAAVSLAILLRSESYKSVEHGLVAESSLYSMLQGSMEFRAWRGSTLPKDLTETSPTVLVRRRSDALTIRLNRPDSHNAINRQMRDELCAALRIGLVDESISAIEISGTGSSFCSGGDLREFGALSDLAEAHLLRLAQSPARLIHELRGKTRFHIHGATLGGGIEMAAFSGHVTADHRTNIGLPELKLGLIPGAGGTVGIPRRIGRQRTLAMALTGSKIGANTALDWGLIDSVTG